MAQPQHSSQTRERTRFNEPRLYKVLMYNDDFTDADFVVRVLQTVFHRPYHEALDLMLNVHNSDHAVVGTYSYDIAMSKQRDATGMAREEGYPLRLECVPAE